MLFTELQKVGYFVYRSMLNSSPFNDPAVEILSRSNPKDQFSKRSALSDLPNIMESDRQSTQEKIPEDSAIRLSPKSLRDDEIIVIEKTKSHSKYVLPRPALEEEDLNIDFERWKKRACCHQFSNKKLEDAFWVFYMDNHT